MVTCGSCQPQLLDYLYDLLEGDEQQAVQDHLALCPACQAALVRARNQKNLLATAARLDFSSVRFEAPVNEAAFNNRPHTLPLPATRPAGWKRWAVAAAVLLALAGTGAPATWFWHDYSESAGIVQNRNLAMADARGDAQKIDDDARAAEQRLRERQEAVEKRQLKVVVTGPAKLQPGAPNQYTIETRNGLEQVIPTRLTVRVLDEAQKVIHEKTDVASDGTYKLPLPINLPVKPNSQLSLEVVAHRDGVAEEVRELLALAGPVYFTHLATDKPMYQPGEVVHFRSLTLERSSLRPPDEDFRLVYSLRKPGGEAILLLSGLTRLVAVEDGKPILGPDGKPLRGLGAGEFTLDAGLAGGEYALVVRDAENRFPPQERRFLVNKYEKPRLNKELEWGRKSYGPNDDVLANCRLSRAEGGAPVANQPVTVTVLIDGKTYDAKGQRGAPFELRTDAEGKVNVHFHLPENIDPGDASLSLDFTDGGSKETLLRPIPLVLKKLHLDFYPEGGDLVANVVNRVYFQARTTLGKPAEVKGRLLDADNNDVVYGIETLSVPDQPGANQGMGLFQFKPEVGKKYHLVIDSPIGIEGKYELPVVGVERVAMSISAGVTTAAEPIRVTLRNPGPEARSLLVAAYCRGQLTDHKQVKVGKGEETVVELQPAQGLGGVYRVTVFQELGAQGQRQVLMPVAERLIYRQPAEALQLAVETDKPQYIPGDKATARFKATNEKNEPVSAVVLVAVVDQSVVTLADEKTARSMPTHFYLTTEVRQPEDLEHADFLLSTHPKAPQALDLLLGTLGWRRFDEKKPDQFQGGFKEAERLLVMQSSPKANDSLKEELQKARTDYDKESVALDDRRAEAQERYEAARTSVAALAASARLEGYGRAFDRMRSAGVPVLAGLMVLVGLAALIVRLLRWSLRPVPYLVGAAACAALLIAFLLVGRAGHPWDRVALDNEGFPDKPADVAVAAKKVAPPLDNRPPEGLPQPEVAKGPDMKIVPPAHRPASKSEDPNAKKNKDGATRRDAPMTVPKRELNKMGLPGDKIDGKEQELKKVADGNGKDKDKKKEDAKGEEDRESPEKKLRAGGMGAMPAGAAGMAARMAPPPPPLPFVVRQYAHLPPQRAAGEERNDFADTLYWQPALVLSNGKGEVSFNLCDSVTTFQVAVMGHTLDGRVGAVTAPLQSRLPFTLEPKLPIEVTASDKIDVPVSIANNTGEARDVTLRVNATGLVPREGTAKETRLTVPAQERMRRVLRLQPNLVEGLAELQLEGETKPFAADSIRRTLPVVPEGFPFLGSRSDVLEKAAQHDIVLPQDWIKGTLKLQAEVFPSTLADLQKGLEGLLREPGGCFEQTSTSNYPNLLILNYLKETEQANPQVEQRAREMLARGYDRLASFECPYTGQGKHGYEWFGAANSAHQALTAYGLLQFRDLSRETKVDEAMIKRTQQYLMEQKDGKGGFQRNARALDTFGRAPEDITNAYIVWALTESGKEDDVGKELDALAGQAKASQDPYFLALVANSLLNRDRNAEAITLLKTVAGLQKPDGHLDAAKTSITGSGGRDLQIETTALAVLGWLKANQPADFNVAVQKAVKWVGQQRGGQGSFGSTQSTILALKALIGFARANKKTAEAGELRLYVGEQAQPVAKKMFEAGTQDAIAVSLPEAEKWLQPGKNTLRAEITGAKNVFPCTLSWSYRTMMPASAANAPVRLSTALDRQTANEGETVQLNVTVENVSGKGQGMTVAIVGLPAGLTLPEDLKQLKQHAELRNDGKEPGLISFFETRGRELVLYWRDLAPDAKVQVPLDLICRVPGEYHGPASRAYLYYNGDAKHWVEPLQVTIKAKE
jgi:hypothetical protein